MVGNGPGKAAECGTIVYSNGYMRRRQEQLERSCVMNPSDDDAGRKKYRREMAAQWETEGEKKEDGEKSSITIGQSKRKRRAEEK